MFEHNETFRPAVRAVILNQKMEALLVRHARNSLWLLPGGGPEMDEVRDGENLIPLFEKETLWRELGEEIDLSPIPEYLLKQRPAFRVGAIEWWNGDRERNMLRLDFVTAIYAGVDSSWIMPRPKAEIGDVVWVDVFHTRRLRNLPENTRTALEITASILKVRQENDYHWGHREKHKVLAHTPMGVYLRDQNNAGRVLPGECDIQEG